MDTKLKTKKISIILVFILMFNFAFPIYSQAAGGPLFKPITQIVCGIGDLCLMTLQKVFLGYGKIEVEDNYRIYYSPYNIFAGDIPALDINFFKENSYNKKIIVEEKNAPKNLLNDGIVANGNAETVEEITYTGSLFKTKKNSINKLKKNYGYDSILDITEEAKEGGIDGFGLGSSLEVAWFSEEENCIYAITDNVKSDYVVGENGSVASSSTTKKVILYKHSVNDMNANSASTFNDSIRVQEKEVKITKTSSPKILGKLISQWYIGLRTLSLVGLMSALIYIGIRMLISSASEDKAKYKKMFADWVVAICLIFVLQYIMAFIVEISEDLVHIISNNTNEQIIKADPLINGIRNTITEDMTFTASFGLLVMYVVLVVYTVMFTITYVRRVVYIAFLTLIAPMVALTYPLDKVKDAKAQAFTIWLREYIFNSLLQVLHLLLYTILVSAAMNLALEHPLYGVVAIGFILPAEKFFRKMFGFEKAETISKVGAFAGSAALMSAMNKLKTMAKKKAAGEEVKKDDIRYSNDNKDTAEGKAGEKTGEAAGGAAGGAAGKATGSAAGAGIGAFVGSIVPGAGTAAGAELGQEIGSEMGEEVGKEAGKKAGGAAGKAVGNAVGKVRKKITEKVKKAAKKKLVKGIKRFAKKKFKGKKIVKKLATKALQAGAGLTLGTIGLAAGIATGSPENALKYGLAGAGAGSALGKGVANRVDSGIQNIKEDKDTFMQGYLGTDYDAYSQDKANKEFMNDVENEIFYSNKFEDYKQAMQDALILRNNGITDNNEIAKALTMAYGMDKNPSEAQRVQNVQKMAYIAGLDKIIDNDSYNNQEIRNQYQQQIAERLNEEAKAATTEEIDSAKVNEEAKNVMDLLGKYKGII